MTSVTGCPTPEVLHRLLDGEHDLPDFGRLIEHLEECTECRRRLDEETLCDLPTVAPSASNVKEDFGPAFYRALDALAVPERPLEERAVADSNVLLRLLDPPTDPRYLGRLGRYDVVGLLGRGGMGIVFRAHDSALNREVAIKILAPHLADRSTARERFAREARAAATISHENVLSIHTVSEAAGLPYLVMPYVVGRSLAEKLEREGRLPIVDVLRIGLQTALGLAAAHERGVVHRDIKPSNLLLEGVEERVKIADFGLAQVVGGSQLTETGMVGGTPEFMAPEQAREESVDARCDLFSLGTVLYTAATGRSPFGATTPLASLRRVCDETPPPITQLNADATAWLAAVVERLLQKNPADRYASAAEVADSLRRQLSMWSQPRRPAPRREITSPASSLSSEMLPIAVPASPSENPSTALVVAEAQTRLVCLARRLGAAFRNDKKKAWAVVGAVLLVLLFMRSPWNGRKSEPSAFSHRLNDSVSDDGREPNNFSNSSGVSRSPGLTGRTPSNSEHVSRPYIIGYSLQSSSNGRNIVFRGRHLGGARRVVLFAGQTEQEAVLLFADDTQVGVAVPSSFPVEREVLAVIETDHGLANKTMYLSGRNF